MAVGHQHAEGQKKTLAELYQMLGEGDTARLYARPVTLDTSHDIAYAGGNSVDGKTVYIDRRLYADIQSGKIAVRGMTAKQIVRCIVEHEHTEWAIMAGDNPVDTYLPSHLFAECKEDEEAGSSRERYEAALKGPVAACARRDPENPPRDLWCGPYRDSEDARDKELLRLMRAKGVVDAFKRSKFDVHYGIRANKCGQCEHYGEPGKVLSPCSEVGGLVRADRVCDLWEAK
jgi:hypothetical protein